MNKQRLLFGLAFAVLVAGFFLSASLYEKNRTAKVGFLAQQDFATFVRPHSQVMGDPAAKVFLIEFTDPACETCAAFSPIVKGLLDRYPGKLKLVLRYAPFHEGSEDVVRMLHASSLQGKFWQTLEVMYGTQPQWASHHQPRPELLWTFLPQANIGLDMDRLRRDAQQLGTVEAVQQDLADAKTLGVTKTPGFLVNGKPLLRFGERELAQLVQQEIAAAYSR